MIIKEETYNPNEEAPGADLSRDSNESCFPSLSEKTRLYCFFGVALLGTTLDRFIDIGVAFQFIATMLVFMHKSAGFATMFTLGWILSFVA